MGIYQSSDQGSIHEGAEAVETQLDTLNHRFESQINFLQSKLKENGSNILEEEGESHPEVKVNIQKNYISIANYSFLKSRYNYLGMTLLINFLVKLNNLKI